MSFWAISFFLTFWRQLLLENGEILRFLRASLWPKIEFFDFWNRVFGKNSKGGGGAGQAKSDLIYVQTLVCQTYLLNLQTLFSWRLSFQSMISEVLRLTLTDIGVQLETKAKKKRHCRHHNFCANIMLFVLMSLLSKCITGWWSVCDELSVTTCGWSMDNMDYLFCAVENNSGSGLIYNILLLCLLGSLNMALSRVQSCDFQVTSNTVKDWQSIWHK